MKAQPASCLVVAANFGPEPTGNAPYTTALASGLARAGIKVSVLTTHAHYPEWKFADPSPPWTTSDDVNGVKVTRLLHFLPRRLTGSSRALAEASFGVRAILRRWANPDSILMVSPALIATAIVMVRARITHPKTPRLIWIQDIYSLGLSETGQGNRLVSAVIRAVEAWALRGSHRIVVIHERFKDYLVSEYKLDPNCIQVIRNWSHLRDHDLIAEQKIRSELGWSNEEIVVLHAGNIGLKQGLDYVIEAGTIADSSPDRIKFVLMGDGTERARLQTRARGIRSVSFLSPQPESMVTSILKAADALLVVELPSVSDMSVPSKLTSYFHAGKPVIAAGSDRGVTRQEVLKAGAGITISSRDPNALVEAVLKLHKDPDLARRLGEGGRRFRIQYLDEQTAVAAFTDALVRARASAETL